MTHDELLAKVKDIPTTKAVVELHKPVAHNGFTLILKKFRDYCNCGENLPCPTIQAIEKELR